MYPFSMHHVLSCCWVLKYDLICDYISRIWMREMGMQPNFCYTCTVQRAYYYCVFDTGIEWMLFTPYMDTCTSTTSVCSPSRDAPALGLMRSGLEVKWLPLVLLTSCCRQTDSHVIIYTNTVRHWDFSLPVWVPLPPKYMKPWPVSELVMCK